jgi:hypothetical protein
MSSLSPIHHMKQNDTSPALVCLLVPTTVLLGGASVVFNMWDMQTGEVKVARAPALIVPSDLPVVRYDWAPGDTDEASTFFAEFEVTYSDGTVETFPNRTHLAISILRDGG